MSYLVFARKWRPQIFDDVIGQEHITDTLKKAIEKDRVAHAYIFSGTRGVGKTTTARILARALNCENGPTVHPCGECATCKNILSGSSFDVLEIDGASNNSVDDIRELRENVGYSAMGGKYRIYVIDEVHMLTKSAFNALLKTLEEPPPNVIFIFATTEQYRIPATIHSRCQRYDFRRIPVEKIQKRLEYICTQERVVFEPAALRLVARKAEGSMRDSLSLLDQVYSFCRESINEAEVRTVLGVVGTERYMQVIDCVKSRQVAPVLQMVEDVLFAGYDLQEFLAGLEEYLRNLLFAKIPGMLDNGSIDLMVEHADRIREQSAFFTEETLLRMAELIRRTQNELKWSPYPRFLVECALSKLVTLESSVSVEQVLASLRHGSGTGSAETPDEKKKSCNTALAGFPLPLPPVSPVVAVITPPPPLPDPVYPPAVDVVPDDDPVFEEPVDSEPINQGGRSDAPVVFWHDFLEVIMRDRPNLGSFLSHAQVSSPSSHSVDVRFPAQQKFPFGEVTRHASREDIQTRLNAFAGRPIEMHITMEAAAVNPQTGAPMAFEPAKPRKSIDDDMEREPIIKTVLDVFDGEVVG